MDVQPPWTRCSQVDGKDDSSDVHIKVITWNVLSQTCVHYHESYVSLSAQDRRQHVAETLEKYDADLVCLQECDFTDDMLYGSIRSDDDSTLVDWLKHQMGYDIGGMCSDAHDTDGGQGVIVLYKRSKMEVIRSTVLHYDEVCQLPRTTGQGAVVLTLRVVQHPEISLVLGGTHLYWDPTVMETVHIPQAQALLSCVREHQNHLSSSSNHISSTTSGKSVPPCVILGDMNDTGNGPCRVLGVDAGNVSAMHDCGCYSSDTPTTVTPWFTGCLDYIWYSRDESVCRVVGHDDSRNILLKKDTGLTYLPNATWPSDHILVGCILSFYTLK
jgi:mRNA deadenylase 3'-5' endonuclease subunit Ccr4